LTWLWFILAGSIAQLVDGSLGMGFGLTSSTLLLTLGTSAALASAAVHIAEVGTTLASGVSHWRRDNVDSKILWQLAVPGGIGAFLGATFLSSVDLSGGKYFVSTILLLLGFVLLYRNLFKAEAQVAVTEMLSPVYLRFLGGIGGFVDAAGGGGWGPIVTPTLLATTKTEPRKVIGTVSAAEFIVAVAASVGFLANLYRLNLDWAVVGGLLIGGVLMAPVAAKLVSWLPKRKLGIAVATMIIVINALRLLGV
jgi:uncharacterized membrane protein YfcA